MLDSIEAILFVASKPLSFAQIAKAIGKQPPDVAEAIENLIRKFNRDDSGIHLFVEDEMVRMGTHPAHADVVDHFIKDEIAGELTKAQLETLTVIAYRGPITRPELEDIRGVNCSVILRNLLMRGLIDEKKDDEKIAIVYTISHDALAHLGVHASNELPGYDELHTHPHLDQSASV